MHPVRGVQMNCLEKIQLQFGRVGGNEFSLDYSHPFTGLQAFAVGVSSLMYKSFFD